MSFPIGDPDVMHRILAAVVHALRSLVRSRIDLVIENATLRQQLAVLKQRRPRPQLQRFDRLFWVPLRHLWSGWAEPLIIVMPETVVRWHKEGFRTYWRWKSRQKGRPKTAREIQDLVHQMAIENEWGAQRIHSERLKLGFLVSERTVSRYMPRRPAGSGAIERWKTFFRNHRNVLAGMDFFSVLTATFQVLYVFFVIGHQRRRILHMNVTAHPTAAWITQQLREAFYFDKAPRYLILDRDGKYGRVVPKKLKSWGVNVVRTGWRSPWQNGVAERWVLSARRELLDHVVVFGETHLRRLLAEYVSYYNLDRCHLALDKDAPFPRDVTSRPTSSSKVVGLPRVGRIHHRYEWRNSSRIAA